MFAFLCISYVITPDPHLCDLKMQQKHSKHDMLQKKISLKKSSNMTFKKRKPFKLISYNINVGSNI